MLTIRQITLFRQSGLTLVELLVAMIISLLLLAGVLQIFISNKTTFRVQEGVSRLQENGRFALEFLGKDVRMADYKGCAADAPTTNTLNCANGTSRPADGICTDDTLFNLSQGIVGFNNVSGTEAAFASITDTPVAGTDVLVIRRNSENGLRITKNNNGAQIFIEYTELVADACVMSDGSTEDKISGICPEDILIISDCSKSRIFQATGIERTGSSPNYEVNIRHSNASIIPGNEISSWGGSSAPDDERFGTDAEIAKVETYIYYISLGSNNQRALFRKVGTASGQELIEGIYDMQIQYGEDTNSDAVSAATQYVTANAVTDWSNVVSVKVNLLLTTINDNLAEDTQTVTYNGGTFIAADKRIYKPFSATFSVRNRLK